MASLMKRPDRPTWYIQYYLAGELKRESTGTSSLQLAKEKLRQFESAQARGEPSPFPTKTPVAQVVSAFARYLRASCTPKSAQTDLYYLRSAFGVICDELKVTSRKPLAEGAKPQKSKQPRSPAQQVIAGNAFELISTAQIATFISDQKQEREWSPKTANRCREVLTRMFNWAMSQHGVRMPADRNPAAKVKRYKEAAPEITFLSLSQIDEQLEALTDNLQTQVMVATLIFAGLRREELLWLTPDDVDFTSGARGLLRVRAKTIAGESWQPKTKINRAVPIHSRLRLLLDKWQLKRTKGTWFFPSPAGKRWDPDNFSQDLRALNQAVGMGWKGADGKLLTPFGCLDYRHTFGSQLAMKGESLYKISVLMGNSPEICRRHYAALAPEALSDSVEFGVAPPKVTIPSVINSA